MSKLPIIKPKRLVKYLCNKRGYIVERISGSHYQLKDSQTGRMVTIPVHRDTLRRGTLKEIMSTVGISKDEICEI